MPKAPEHADKDYEAWDAYYEAIEDQMSVVTQHFEWRATQTHSLIVIPSCDRMTRAH